jgi:hypothetical protein
MAIVVPTGFTIITAHTSISSRTDKFDGFVIARRPGARQGIKIWSDRYASRDTAIRYARAIAKSAREGLV